MFDEVFVSLRPFGKTSLLLVAGLSMALAGCAATVENRGYVADPAKMAAIQPQVDTKETVLAALGTPSSTSPFDDSTWYYISSTTKHYNFQQPRVIDRQVTAIHFDKDGSVSDIDRYDKKDGKDVAMVGRTTPTKGRQLTVMQQLLGNFGRQRTSTPATTGVRSPHIPGQGPSTGSRD